MAEQLTLKKKFSKKEFQKRADEILGSLFREATAFADTSEAAKKARRDKAGKDFFEFCHTYLPHYFNTPEAPFHHELVALLEKRPNQRSAGGTPAPLEVVVPVVVAAPREFAKTTVCSFAYVLFQIVYKRRHFIILGSDTEDLASDLTGYLYLELLYNERLRADFGELVRDGWSVDDFVTLNDIRLKARGRGQRLRGLKHKQFRPDLIILDDLENDQNVRSPEQCRKVLKWVLQVVYPCIDPDTGGNLFWIGTILAQKSALHTAIHSQDEPWPEWTRRIYKALNTVDGQLTSLWPAKHPVEKLLRQKQLMGSFAFNTEKQNEPVNEEGVFQEQWIRTYDPADLSGKNLVIAGFFDASIEAKATSDFKALITLGLDRKEMIFYVLDAFIRKCSLDMAFAAMFERHQQWGYWLLGIEDNLFQKLLLRELARLEKERGVMLPTRGITQTIAKETRISSMSSLVERGRFRFLKGQGNQDLLIEQLIYFPSTTVHDDGPDAMEGAYRLLTSAPAQGLMDFYREEVEKQRAEEARKSGQTVAVMHG